MEPREKPQAALCINMKRNVLKHERQLRRASAQPYHRIIFGI